MERRSVAGSAECDPSSNTQFELAFVAGRFKGQDPATLLSDPAFQEWVANLWNRHQPFLLQFARHHVRDRAEEVVQDMWVDFVKSVPRFEGRCSTKTWLIQILRRCIQKEQRRTVFTRAHEALMGLLGRGHDESYPATMEDSGGNWYENPEHLVLAQECLDEIWRAGRALAKRQAEVWFLRDVDGYSLQEVSAALGITTENQRVLRHRAHERLKAELRRYLGNTKAPQPVRKKAHDLQRS
jgi:RNA polymerase sigma-70 factor, ECF subfamily